MPLTTASFQKRRSPKKYLGATPADVEYRKGIESGLTPKEAAKQAQFVTGLSLLTGQRMKTRGFGWQSPKETKTQLL